MNPRTLRVLTLSVGLVALGAGIGTWSARWYRPTPVIEGLMWPNPKQIGTFQVVDQDGREFGVEQLRGKWSFLFFGYTHCPDICPITLAVLARVQESLAADAPGGVPTQTVFVSVDPERDSPQQLAQYVRHFDERSIGLGGTSAQVQGLTAQLGIAFYHAAPAADGNYLVDHSASVFLLDPQARLVSIFPAPQDADRLLAKFRQIREFIEQASS